MNIQEVVAAAIKEEGKQAHHCKNWLPTAEDLMENHNCNRLECRHTSEIEHAANFTHIRDEYYVERLRNQSETQDNPNDFEYEVTKYPVFDRVVVSFQLPYHGWKKLEESRFWKSAIQYLAEIQKGHNPM